MKFLKNLLIAAVLAVLPIAAQAQVVTQLPLYADNNPNAVLDLGNGPLQIKILQGNMAVWTMSNNTFTGTASSASTALTLNTSAAATPPCVGCAISGAGIAAGTTVAAFNGTTGITLSQNTTAALSATPVAFGMACPTTLGTGYRMALFQAGQPAGDPPFYTTARLCATGQNNTGAMFLSFPIGAH